MSKEIKFHNGGVVRKFTPEWGDSGMIRVEKIADVVSIIVTQRKEMMDYIEALHDKIDWILEKNQCCDVNGCLTAGCGSDHK